MTDYTKLTNEELNTRVAEDVMKWKLGKVAPAGIRWYDTNDERIKIGVGESNVVRTWSPTTNVAHDYEVLVHVRETWDLPQKHVYRECLADVLAAHDGQPPGRKVNLLGMVNFYRPGDYSKAALAAIEAVEEQK